MSNATKFLFCVLICLSISSIFAEEIGNASSGQGGKVIIATVEGAITPVIANFMVEAIEKAEVAEANCIVFELDTPGGLDESMRQIIKKIMAAKVPVVIYVAPSGSRAASAGAFITLSAHIAAMAPGTTIGAAHPVALGGSTTTNEADVSSQKITEDAAAFIRSIAAQRGRNVEWANNAVKQSVSLHETEALEKKVIDLIAPNTQALLEQIDGRVVELQNGKKVTLKTKGVLTENVKMNWRDRILATIANPNLAYILFLAGLVGLYFEFSNPGAVLPGVVGAISLILAFYSFNTLSVNYAGVLLILLAAVLFVMEMMASTHGILALGGIISMFLGSLMLFDAPDPAMRLSLTIVVPSILAVGGFFLLASWLSIKAMFRKPVVGANSLIGQIGDARSDINEQAGIVFLAGTHWNAISSTPNAKGSLVRVVEVQGMKLVVEPLNKQ